IRHGHAAHVSCERNGAALKEEVADFGPLPVDRKTEREAVPALDPAQPVGPFKTVPYKGAAQVITGAEKPGDAVLLDHRAGLALLLINGHAEVLPIRHSRGRAALGKLPDVSEMELIQQGGAESMGHADVRILHARPRSVGVAGVVMRIEVGSILE